MMLHSLSLTNFRNYEDASFTFGDGLNCFLGNNGAGKTNLLDAVYYLSFCKSAFNPADNQNIFHGAGFFVIRGEYAKGSAVEKVHCSFRQGERKQFTRNGKEYKRLADHIGLLPLVLLSPHDMNLITGVSGDRRKFLDSVIAQCDRVYLEHLMNYNKVLLQRNALLKRLAEKRGAGEETLEILDRQMLAPAQEIYTRRKEFVAKLTPIFCRHYEAISAGGAERVKLTYRSHLDDDTMENLLQQSDDRDRFLQYTSAGVHRDDLLFHLGAHPVKRTGSQGQQKTYLVALKLAQYELLKEVKKEAPILLFDDVFDKLDEARVTGLMKAVAGGSYGQVFLTDAHTHRLPAILGKSGADARLFEVRSGKVSAQNATTAA